MILGRCFCSEKCPVFGWNRSCESRDSFDGKQNAKFLARVIGKKEVCSWVRVENPVVGKCACCCRVSRIDDVEVGLFSLNSLLIEVTKGR